MCSFKTVPCYSIFAKAMLIRLVTVMTESFAKMQTNIEIFKIRICERIMNKIMADNHKKANMMMK